MEKVADYFKRVFNACQAIDTAEIEELIHILETAYQRGKKIFIFGNGGSGATASHFCEDLAKGTLVDLNQKERFRVISLTDNVPFILALANDEGFETIFEQQMINLAEPGDVAIGISGSGRSKNVLNAIEYANRNGLTTVGMTGFNGGELRRLAQHCVHVPVDDMGIVENAHLIIVHHIIDVLRVGKQQVRK